MAGCGLDLSGSGRYPLADFPERSNEPLVFHNMREIS